MKLNISKITDHNELPENHIHDMLCESCGKEATCVPAYFDLPTYDGDYDEKEYYLCQECLEEAYKLAAALAESYVTEATNGKA